MNYQPDPENIALKAAMRAYVVSAILAQKNDDPAALAAAFQSFDERFKGNLREAIDPATHANDWAVQNGLRASLLYGGPEHPVATLMAMIADRHNVIDLWATVAAAGSSLSLTLKEAKRRQISSDAELTYFLSACTFENGDVKIPDIHSITGMATDAAKEATTRLIERVSRH